MTMIKILISIFLFIWISCLAISQTSQWRIARGTENIAIDAMDICRSSPDTLYAFGDSVVDNYVHFQKFMKSTDRGETWNTIKASSGYPYYLAIDPTNPQIMYNIYLGQEDLGCYYLNKTYDGGEHWTNILRTCGLYRSIAFEIDPINSQVVYALRGWGWLNRSTDGGQTWSYDSIAYDYPKSLSVSPVNDSIIYLSGNVLLRSVDFSFSWVNLTQIPGPSVIHAHPKDPKIVYAGVSGTGMYKSTDMGETWIEINNGLSNYEIINFAINQKRPDEIYLGLRSIKSIDKLIYKTTNGGVSWFEFSDGLPALGSIVNIIVDTTYEKAFIAVSSKIGYGIYIHDISTGVVEIPRGIPTAYTLEQNYPNPFNPQTTIFYAIAEDNRVRLTVTNILGQEVKLLVDEYQNTGYKSVTFEAGDLPSGIYFYRLQTGKLNSVKKMMLAK